MRRVVLCAFLISHFSFLISPVSAQPKARRQQQQKAAKQQKSQQTQNQGMTMRARLTFPTAVDMPENVVWRRDIYRELDLNKDANAGLYYPVEPIDKQLNLVCTYDVYNKKGTKVRENCVAENDLSGLKDVTIARGKKVVVNLTVEPTYLYQLSEDELDNPTIKSE